jgi:shikimate kinase
MTTHDRADAPVFLIGFMASGKTTVGRLVAEGLGWQFRDLDQVITDGIGRSVAQIFADDGEAGFRRRENEALKSVAQWPRTVVATGGGAACQEPNLSLMLASGRVIALVVTPEEVLRRAGADSGRPLLATSTSTLTRSASSSTPTENPDSVKAASDLLAAREAFYARAHHRVDTMGKAPEDVAAEVIHLLQTEPA